MMNSRMWKYAALIVSGGIVLQLSGCAQTAAQIGLSLLFRTIISGVLDVLTGAATQAAGTA
jgi:hypothetical protein